MTDAVRRYHTVAMSLHWLIGLAIIVNLAMGLLMGKAPDELKFTLYQLHKSIGITILALSVLRLAWRLWKPPPPELANLKKWEIVVSGIVHTAFYFFMFALPLTGWAMVSASPMKLPTYIFGLFPLPHLPMPATDDPRALAGTFNQAHEILAYVLIALLAMHIGAALYHHWLRRDEVLFRMTPRWSAPLLRFLRGQKA